MCKTGLKAESMGMHKQNPSCFVILKQKLGRERNNDNSTYLYNGSHYRLSGCNDLCRLSLLQEQ